MAGTKDEEFIERLRANFRKITNEDLAYFGRECRAIKMVEEGCGESARTEARWRELVFELEVRAGMAPPIEEQDRTLLNKLRADFPGWFTLRNLAGVAALGLAVGHTLAWLVSKFAAGGG